MDSYESMLFMLPPLVDKNNNQIDCNHFNLLRQRKKGNAYRKKNDYAFKLHDSMEIFIGKM